MCQESEIMANILSISCGNLENKFLDLTLRAFNDISDMSHTMELFVIIWSGHHPSLLIQEA